jgi:hypothetical protein
MRPRGDALSRAFSTSASGHSSRFVLGFFIGTMPYTSPSLHKLVRSESGGRSKITPTCFVSNESCIALPPKIHEFVAREAHYPKGFEDLALAQIDLSSVVSAQSEG